MFALSDLRRSAELVHSVMPSTPQYCWPLLCKRLGCEIWVKHENHTPIGSFKLRGGIVFVEQLRRTKPKVSGIVSASRGNHGQSLGFAARKYGLTCTVVVPHGNSTDKVLAMREFGVTVIEHGDEFQQASEFADTIANDAELYRVHSYHPLLAKGVSSYALEFFTQVPPLDRIYVPVGMGSSICGTVMARDALALRTSIIGVVSSAAPAYALSFNSGSLVEHRVTTQVADGLACRTPDSSALEIIRSGVERFIEVTDDEVKAAIRTYFSTTHNVVEGAGAAALAAAFRDRPVGKRIGVLLSGGNIDRNLFVTILQGEEQG